MPVWAVILLLVSCAADPVVTQSSRKLTDNGTVTYSGNIPCADCAGRSIVLTLFPDHLFRMRQTYLGVLNGQDKDFYDLGRWILDNGSDRLRLYGGKENFQYFRVLGPDRLRMLDIKGDEIDSKLDYELTRQQDIDLVEGPVVMNGMYMYMADVAVFKECITGKSYPVLLEADHLALERAYLSMRIQPGESIPVTFKGRFVQRILEPGLPVREHLIVEQFEQVLPGKTCPNMTSDTGLFETHWYPVEIGGKFFSLESNQREPYFVLSGHDHRVTGFTGCNRLTGSFELDEGLLRFVDMATTRMACPSPAMEVEMRFVSALNAVKSYYITGNTLELTDANRVVRMRLKAKNFQ